MKIMATNIKFILFFIILIIYMLIIEKISLFFYTSNNFDDFVTIDSTQLLSDAKGYTGYYIPSNFQKGLRIIVEENDKSSLFLILTEGTYLISFYEDNKLIFSNEYNFEIYSSQILDINLNNIFSYNSIIIQTIKGEKNRLIFLAPINSEDELNAFQTQYWLPMQSSLGAGTYYALNPDRSQIQAITANLVDFSEDTLSLNIKNVSNMDIELISINRLGKDSSYDFNNVTLSKDLFGQENVITIPFSNFDNSKDYEIVYKYVGLDFESRISISMLDNTNSEIVYSTGIVDTSYDLFENYFKIDGQSIILLEDNTVIDQAVIIPSGYILKMSEGQSITFINDGFIRSYSPIEFIGSEDNPISIQADGLSQSGIAVIQANATSHVQYTNFDNLTNISYFAYTTSGAVNFFESDLDMSYSSITNNRSEDGLNVVRSHFDVAYTKFENTYSDAFDSDFSNGVLRSSQFLNTGNDGFDCSGSNVSVVDTNFIVIGDKALSIGEHTTISGTNLLIDTSDLGIAIKDSSTSSFDGVEFNDVYLSFIQYNKKPVFGLSSSSLSNISFNGDIGLKYLIQEHEHLMVDGVTYVPENLSKSEQIFDALINERPIR